MGRDLQAHPTRFDKLYHHSQALHDDIDTLASATRPTQP